MVTLEQLKAIRKQRKASDIDSYKRFGHLPSRSGGYRTFKSVTEAFRNLTSGIRRDCCKVTTHRLAVWLVRMQGAPRNLNDRPEFYLDTRELALNADLALTRDEIMTGLDKLTSIPYEVVHGVPLYVLERSEQKGSKYQQSYSGEPWRKPILWRFTAEFRSLLNQLHARMRCFQKSSIYQGSLKSSSSLSSQHSRWPFEKKKQTESPSYMEDFNNTGQKLRSFVGQAAMREDAWQPNADNIDGGSTVHVSIQARMAKAFKTMLTGCDPRLATVPDLHDDSVTTVNERRLDRHLAKRCINAPTVVERRGVAVDDPGLRMALTRVRQRSRA